MAREESDREDLLREATALVERVELARTGDEEHVVAGFRVNGAASFFFGTDPVFQFNAAGELRRAYCQCQLIKASAGQLIALTRQREENAVYLLSRALTSAEQQHFIEEMRRQLRNLSTDLRAGHYAVVSQVPEHVDIVRRVQEWLSTHDDSRIASSARVAN